MAYPGVYSFRTAAAEAGDAAAARLQFRCRPGDREPAQAGSRKVRTPQGRTLGKSQAAKADGKWHRKETAADTSPEVSAVRVKGWGKSPPAPW
jgi:hypothetical protein